MKKTRIALVLVLGIMLVAGLASGLACCGGDEASPTPTPTQTATITPTVTTSPTPDTNSYISINSTPPGYFVEIGTDENYTPGSGRIACVTPCLEILLPEDVVTEPPPDGQSFIHYRILLVDGATINASIGLLQGQLEPGKTYYYNIDVTFNTSS